jgi:hypothetical protein
MQGENSDELPAIKLVLGLLSSIQSLDARIDELESLRTNCPSDFCSRILARVKQLRDMREKLQQSLSGIRI